MFFLYVFQKIITVQIRNVGFKKICLDSPTRKSDHHKPVGLYPCHRQGGNQVYCRSYYYVRRQYQYYSKGYFDSKIRFASACSFGPQAPVTDLLFLIFFIAFVLITSDSPLAFQFVLSRRSHCRRI